MMTVVDLIQKKPTNTIYEFDKIRKKYKSIVPFDSEEVVKKKKKKNLLLQNSKFIPFLRLSIMKVQ